MACYHPLTGYRGNGGKIVFSRSKGFTDLPPITIPCGQCIGCRLERSRQWAIRCMHEASLYPDNCFLTLTYRNEDLPLSHDVDFATGEVIQYECLPTLNKRDIVLFLKRLRKRFGEGIRFFQCGEYGDKFARPHHHVLLFNFDFPDKYIWSTREGIRFYRSPILEELWPHGNSLIGNVTFESAAYVARYVTKKITGDSATQHYLTRQPEYITMSRRPGIGRAWFEKFYSDVYPSDSCVVRNGNSTLIARPPKYYDNLYDLQDSDEMCRIKVKRLKFAKLSSDSTPDRLLVRERVQALKAVKLIRGYEKGDV